MAERANERQRPTKLQLYAYFQREFTGETFKAWGIGGRTAQTY